MSRLTASAVLLSLLISGCSNDSPTEPDTSGFPANIALPDGFTPEGVAFGRGSTFFVGSIYSGAIFRADARTGSGTVFVSGDLGREAVGMKFDQANDRLYVAGGLKGTALVYNATSGALLATYQLADPDQVFTSVNDLVITDTAVYFTDDSRPVIYRLPRLANGTLPAPASPQTISLTGDFEFVPDALNGNGIVATPGGQWLIVVNTTTGKLSRVNPSNGQATTIDLGGGSVPGGDGLALMDHTLYGVEGALNRIAVVALNSDWSSGQVTGSLTSPGLNFPSTIAVLGASLYAVNARFDVEPGPEVKYSVVKVER